MSFIASKIEETGMFDCTSASGWGRSATAAGHSTITNMWAYGAFVSGSKLATWLDKESLATEWETTAATLETKFNGPGSAWEPTVGAFKNTPADNIFPEDGNSMAMLFDGAKSSYSTKISDYLTTQWSPIGAKVPELPGSISPYVESYEIMGHLKVRQALRALNLIRLSWGWYLNNPMGTGSSAIVGYKDGGSFLYTANERYDKADSYPSHAHGWSTGPVDALVSQVVGLQPSAPGGSNWTLSPQIGDLSHAQGGFTTTLGNFSASWLLPAA